MHSSELRPSDVIVGLPFGLRSRDKDVNAGDSQRLGDGSMKASRSARRNVGPTSSVNSPSPDDLPCVREHSRLERLDSNSSHSLASVQPSLRRAQSDDPSYLSPRARPLSVGDRAKILESHQFHGGMVGTIQCQEEDICDVVFTDGSVESFHVDDVCVEVEVTGVCSGPALCVVPSFTQVNDQTYRPQSKDIKKFVSRMRTTTHSFGASSSLDGADEKKEGACLIIHPTGPFRVSWDAAVLGIIAYQVVWVPVEYCFDVPPMEWYTWIDLMTGIFFVIDLVLNCRTGYISPDGDYVYNWRKIMQRYALSPPYWFFLDLIATLPLLLSIWEAVGGAEYGALARTGKVTKITKQLRAFKLLRLLRFSRMFKITQSFLERISGRQKALSLMMMINLIVFIMLFFHFLSCLWATVSEFQKHAAMADYSIGTDVASNYRFSFWWVVSMMVTGEGVTPPQTGGESLLWALMSCMSVVVNNAFLAILLWIFANLVRDGQEEFQRTCIAQRFSFDHKLPTALKFKMLSAIKHNSLKWRDFGDFEHDVQPLLSPDLLQQVYGYVYDKHLQRFPPFVDGDQFEMEELRHKLAVAARRRQFNTGDLILKQNDEANSMIFFVSGEAVMQAAQDGVPFSIGEGWWLGEKVLFWESSDSRPVRSATVKALTPCTVLEIHQDDFLHIVEELRLGEWLEEQKTKPVRGLKWGCQVCGSTEHWFKECPTYAEQAREVYARRSKGRVQIRSRAKDNIAEYMREEVNSTEVARAFGGLQNQGGDGKLLISHEVTRTQTHTRQTKKLRFDAEGGQRTPAASHSNATNVTNASVGASSPHSSANSQSPKQALSMDEIHLLRESISSQHRQMMAEFANVHARMADFCTEQRLLLMNTDRSSVASTGSCSFMHLREMYDSSLPDGAARRGSSNGSSGSRRGRISGADRGRVSFEHDHGMTFGGEAGTAGIAVETLPPMLEESPVMSPQTGCEGCCLQAGAGVRPARTSRGPSPRPHIQQQPYYGIAQRVESRAESEF